MTQTRIRIGQVAVDGMPRMPSGEVFGKRLQAALTASLRQQPSLGQDACSIPQLRLTLPHGASEADIATAVARALRDAIVRGR